MNDVLLQAHQVLMLAAGAAAVPNPAPGQLPGQLGTDLNTIIGWGKTLAIAFGVVGLIACGVMMMVGRRNRHSFAADGAAGVPWVLGGLALVSVSSAIVGVFL